MVEKHRKNINNQDSLLISEKQSSELNIWIRTLQQALTVEVNRDFINVQGRKEKFSSFICNYLMTSPSCLLFSDNQVVNSLAEKYNKYSSMSIERRRRLVVRTRQYLHGLSKHYAPLRRASSPKLNIQKISASNISDISPANHSLSLESSIAEVKGIGSRLAERLSGLGLLIIKDLLLNFPRDYVDYTSLKTIDEIKIGDTVTIVAKVRRCSSFISPKNPNLSILELFIKDNTGSLKVTRFLAGRRRSNFSYLKTQERLYPSGSTVVVSGLVKENQFGKSINDPLIEVIESPDTLIKSRIIGQIFPIYTLTDGITADKYRNIIQSVLPLTSFFIESIPVKTLEKHDLPCKQEALFNIHNPDSSDSLARARRRLVFEEFLLLQLSLLLKRNIYKKRGSPLLDIKTTRNSLVSKFLDILPFTLTNAQKRVLREVEIDLARSEPMSRLLQGDVGSGKTVIAIAALLHSVQSGWQGAFMAPTEVLAAQHYRTLIKWNPQLELNVELLTGSTTKVRRNQILTDLVNGSTNILVGTHALFEDPVVFERLGLVVVDEQHRFGVDQRNRLLNKGLQPHLLTMTATPIPRTLALSFYGDLDVSQIDELPPGRTPIETMLISSSDKKSAYDLIRIEINKGHQAYVVLPLIEESEKLELSAAVTVHKDLSNDIFPDLRVELLHGRMKGLEKQDVIRKFLEKKIDILVSTTVIEVGVDVANASVMYIDNADRFGLSQLHQLRGRVGRGASKSYCLLGYQRTSKLSRQRLDVLVSSNDGFEISEIDLRFRGPGQVLGTNQSGLPDFALASLTDDASVLESARKEASIILESDPELNSHSILKNSINDQWEKLRIANKLN